MEGRDEAREGLRAPLEDALASEVLRLQGSIARVWVLLSAVGVLGGVVLALTVARSLGIATAALGAAVCAFFAWGARRASRGVRTNPALLAVVEGALPWMFLLVLAGTQGAAYAIASWVPPMMFCAVIIGWTARVEPRPPVIVGALGAATYVVAYYAWLHARVPDDGFLIWRPAMQWTRAVSLLIAGLGGGLVARELRRVIGRAERAVRREELFGKYRLVRKVASGGAGVVHEALYCPEGGFERRVAVKMMHPHLASEPGFVAAFRAEAELGARLAHPNVVTILDFGMQADAYFLSMEYVDGAPLSRVLSRAHEAEHTLSTALVAHVGRAVLDGLEHAHEGVRGADARPLRIVHRDLCPQNVLCSRIGEVKVADFGIARALGDAASAHTRTVAGHEAYMAPEQARAEPMDARTDLFSVGVVLWEMLAARRLFARPNPGATMLAVVSDEIPPITLVRADLDPAWDAFFASALSRDPYGRFPSARAMRAALDALPGARGADPTAELAGLVRRAADAKGQGAAAQTDDAPTVAAPSRG